VPETPNVDSPQGRRLPNKKNKDNKGNEDNTKNKWQMANALVAMQDKDDSSVVSGW